MRHLELRGRTAVITGGASGIGLALADQFVQRGGVPALVDLDADAAIEQAARLGGGAIGVGADVTDLDGLDRAFAEIAELRRGLDVLVANAGIVGRAATADAGDQEMHRRVLDINLHGVWHTLSAGVPHVAARSGHIVVISSIAAFIPAPGLASYGASKAAVETLARAARIELAPAGVTVGVAHFGLVDTPLITGLTADPFSARCEAMLPGPMRSRVRPEDAARTLIRDIERRAARTIFPRMYVPQYLLRGVLGPLTDAAFVRLASTRRLMQEMRSRDRVKHGELVAS
jgi:NAD(P)-dependent dehydrogenase (short-subunit alcohol dehydrogenase family)